MEFYPDCPEQFAGLSYMYDAANFYLFGKTVDEEGQPILCVIKTDTLITTDEIVPVKLPEKGPLWLRIVSGSKEASCLYSFDGQNWLDTGARLDTEILTDEHCRGFTGAHMGMYCHDMTGRRCYADFDDYFMNCREEDGSFSPM